MLDRVAIAGNAVFIAAPPPRKSRPIEKLVLTGDAKPERVWFIHDQAVGVMVHYDLEKNRSYPCTGDGCWFDHSLSLPRWQGWIGVLCYSDTRVRMMHITPGLAAYRPELVDQAAKLRGKCFEVWRRGRGQFGALFGKWVPELDRHQELPRPFDVKTHLIRLWTGEGKGAGAA